MEDACPMEEAPLLVFFRTTGASFVCCSSYMCGVNSASRDQEKQTPKQTHTTLGLSQGTAQGDGTSCTLDLYFRVTVFYNCLNCFKLL